ncbi:MAG: F0F1 ATP synthase subunit B [Bacteroidales bacterium]|jgi:F-type H+-transporting ATPase subunit b|nr:F0F1 ATP synthase subunit B [Bacteroidales bacterium]
MELVQPGIGLIFWTTIIFLCLLLLLRKFAWKPILGMINKRNQSIEEALNQAELARQEMKNLTANNEKIMAEARVERDNILKQAREVKDEIILQAKENAVAEVLKIKRQAEIDIENQKAKAIEEMKNKILELSILVAEKVVRQELSTTTEHEILVNKILDNVKLN